jgi:glucose dehydrogenase
MFKSQPLVSATQAVPVKPVAPGEQQKNWEHWGNTTHGDRFAALDQINKQNVNQLQVAWVAHTGDIPQSNGSGAEDQNTPLQIGDTLYVCTPYSKVLALDVDSGKENGAMMQKPPRQTGSAAAVSAITKTATPRPPPRVTFSRPPAPGVCSCRPPMPV